MKASFRFAAWTMVGLFAVTVANQASATDDQRSGRTAGILREPAAVAEIPDDGPAIAEIPAPASPAVVRAAATAAATQFYGQRLNPRTIRQQVDPNDNIERFVLLGPGGPIVVQATLFLDGKPFRTLREQLVDETLKLTDLDGDGKHTWEEAFRNPRFGFGRSFQFSQLSEQQRKEFIRGYDVNDDGLVDRYETRAFIAQIAGGAEFQIAANSGVPALPDILTLLDVDRDGAISPEELAAAFERLKSRDANGNDLVEGTEIGAIAAAGYARGTAGVAMRTANASLALPLGASENASVRTALRQKYGRNDGRRTLTAESFPLFPRLLDSLDRNANGEVEDYELSFLNLIRPHIAVTVRLGKAEGITPGMEVTWLAPELRSRESNESAEVRGVSWPGAALSLSASSQQLNYNYRPSAEAMLARYDADQNGYIEKSEIKDVANGQYLTQLFERWDANGDGKVYVDEILAEYDRTLAPQLSQVSVSAADRGSSLFTVLDQSGDGRLSLREMRTAADRLKSLDANGDGRLSGDEVPVDLSVSFARGPQYGRDFRVPAPRRVAAAPAAVRKGPDVPKWFEHMDRNGDGDLTVREFLGKEEQFRELDRNGDGFVEPAEANAAPK